MDDFLGTSIQYSELQIKLLEKEHYENQQKIVEELISSGFLDSDYEEDSTETEFESTDNESSEASLEIKENDNLNESESPSSFELIDDSTMNISPKSLIDSSEEISSPSPSSSSSDNNNNNNNLNMVLSSDISVVDELNVSNSESINDATINNQIIHKNNTKYRNIDNEYKAQEYEQEYEHKNGNEYNSDNQIQDIQQFDIVTSKAIIRLMEFVFSDIKYVMILLILMIAYPHISNRAHHDNDSDMPQFYGDIHSDYRGQHGCYRRTTIHWNLAPYYQPTTTQTTINDEDDERDEYQNDDDDQDNIQLEHDQNKDQCLKKQQILSFDIMTTTFDMNKKLRRAHLERHEIPIPNLCNNGGSNNMKMKMNMLRNIPIPREMHQIFMNIGGISGSVRAFKSTSIASVGRHFGRTQGLYALVMAFVGIAGFASNNIDEIMSITISS